MKTSAFQATQYKGMRIYSFVWDSAYYVTTAKLVGTFRSLHAAKLAITKALKGAQ